MEYHKWKIQCDATTQKRVRWNIFDCMCAYKKDTHNFCFDCFSTVKIYPNRIKMALEKKTTIIMRTWNVMHISDHSLSVIIELKETKIWNLFVRFHFIFLLLKLNFIWKFNKFTFIQLKRWFSFCYAYWLSTFSSKTFLILDSFFFL